MSEKEPELSDEEMRAKVTNNLATAMLEVLLEQSSEICEAMDYDIVTVMSGAVAFMAMHHEGFLRGDNPQAADAFRAQILFALSSGDEATALQIPEQRLIMPGSGEA